MDASELTHLARLHSRGHWGIKRGLENPRLLLEGLQRPDKNFPVVLIAGTNGKGSTGAFMANALRAAGLRVGWTTSPHLVSPAERIWVDGACVNETQLDGLLSEVFEVEAAAGIQATYFELMIASAILAFRQQRVDIALVEVGLGGRWDATNALDPVLTVLTNVALDHTMYWARPWKPSLARSFAQPGMEGR
jgi:dihydrofolate synthase/folylpolyglutamate synthase